MTIIPTVAHADEGKLKTALSLRTHAKKILESDSDISKAAENLALARQALEDNHWEIVAGYLNQAADALKGFSTLFPSSAAREKLRNALALYQQKKFAQSAAILEQMTEELRWLVYYKNGEDLGKQIEEAQGFLIRQKKEKFEKAIAVAMEKVSLPMVDQNLAAIEGEVYLSLAAWKGADHAATLQHLQLAEKGVARLALLIDLAQARHYLSRSNKFSQNRLKMFQARRTIKKGIQRMSKLMAKYPDNKSVQECLNATKKVRHDWGRNEDRAEQEMGNLLKQMDSLLVASSQAGSQ